VHPTLVAAGPNWLGSPQHFFGGLGLAFVLVVVLRLLRVRPATACALAVGVVSTVEIAIELVEYPLLYADKFHASAYYDTLADMGNTLVGAVAGVVIGAISFAGFSLRRRRRSQRAPGA
jgi:hypothetical protein